MTQIITTLTEGVGGWITLLVLVAVGVAYLFSRVRQADMKLLRDSNVDLRDAISDRDEKIEAISRQVAVLEGKVDVLEKKNKNLEDLVVVALKQYFFENPKLVPTIQQIITNNESK